jgi:undecaprenyl-diphosphatase
MYAWSGWKQELAVSAALAGTFGLLMLTVVAGAPTAFDRWLAGYIQAIPWNIAAIPQFASDVGGGLYGTYLVPVTGAVVLGARKQWRALALLASVFALHYLLISPKLFIDANRPSPAFGVEGAGGFESFPSGHVEWAVSLYGFLAYLLARSLPRYRWPIAGGYAAIVVLTMLSRIELGRHWPIDTFAGLLVGLLAVRILVGLHALPPIPWRSLVGSRKPALASASVGKAEASL